MKDRRFHYVDAARGIAVLLVIYGHTFRESMRAAYAWCDFSYTLVYRFHVSLLFLLSGFGYALTLEKNKTLTEWRYLGKKAKLLTRRNGNARHALPFWFRTVKFNGHRLFLKVQTHF
mgnify:CR=1 FL=1